MGHENPADKFLLRHATLSSHAALTLAVFIVEMWEQR